MREDSSKPLDAEYYSNRYNSGVSAPTIKECTDAKQNVCLSGSARLSHTVHETTNLPPFTSEALGPQATTQSVLPSQDFQHVLGTSPYPYNGATSRNVQAPENSLWANPAPLPRGIAIGFAIGAACSDNVNAVSRESCSTICRGQNIHDQNIQENLLHGQTTQGAEHPVRSAVILPVQCSGASTQSNILTSGQPSSWTNSFNSVGEHPDDVAMFFRAIWDGERGAVNPYLSSGELGPGGCHIAP